MKDCGFWLQSIFDKEGGAYFGPLSGPDEIFQASIFILKNPPAVGLDFKGTVQRDFNSVF